MEELFQINGNITAMQESYPIRFAHHKTMDDPQKHILHLNNYVEFYFYVDGNHQYIVENSLYKLRRGDIIVINPREVHKALAEDCVLYERFYILVDQHTFEKMYQDPLAPIINKSATMGNLICVDDATREKILELLYAISDCFQDGRDDQLRALGYFLLILDAIGYSLKQGASSVSDVAHTPDLLKKILVYVAENTANIQSITEISSALGVTPQYLSSYFNNHIGTPLKTYIQAKKIALAKDLLDRGADVTRACYDCGFNDCSYFIRVFKKYVGITPMNYKRRLKSFYLQGEGK